MDITVWVKPGSRKGPLVVDDTVEDGHSRYTVFLRERAVNGQANAALLRVVADHFQVPKSAVRVIHGHASRLKRIRVDIEPELTS